MTTKKIRLATIWLDGCSGCHMSFLDMDERLIELSDKIDIVFSPYVDQKEFPKDVDVTLIEGAISTDEDIKKVKLIRERTKVLVSFGDCAVTSNIVSMRNPFGISAVLQRAYLETSALPAKIPNEDLPTLMSKARPVHEFVDVDAFIPGCPPHADLIHFMLSEILEGRNPGHGVRTRFG